jgi:hypothetical protein
MRNQSSLLLVCVFALITSNCRYETEGEKYTAFEKIAEYAFPIDPKNQVNSFTVRYHEASRDQALMLYLCRNQNEILIFDIHKQKLLEKIPFEKRGPEGLGTISGFHILNLDNIILSSPTTDGLVVVDSHGRIKEKIKLSETRDGFAINRPSLMSRNNSQIVFFEDKWIIPNEFYLSGNLPTPEILAAHSLFLERDASSGSISSLPIRPPTSAFPDWQYYLGYFSMTHDGKKIVYGFFCDHNLHATSKDLMDVKATLAKSRYIDKFVPTGPGDNPFQYLAAAPMYRNLLYDSYRKLFYRIVKIAHDPEKHNQVETQQAYEYPFPFSIMILGEDLRALGEVYFPDPFKYNWNQVFVGREGLFISVSNPMNPDYEESTLRFEVLLPR